MKRVQIVSIQQVREKSLMVEQKSISSPEIAAEIFQTFLGEIDREAFIMGCLDMKNQINALNLVSIGTLNATLVQPREVFKAAILSNAASIILCHNHPSGNRQPSHEDINTTKTLKEAGKILGIPVLDHIILGYNSFFSFKEEGML